MCVLVYVCVCVWKRVSSSSAGTAHSVSRGVPPGTELTENFTARGEPGSAGHREHSRVPHFQSFAEKHAAFPISSLARSPGINPKSASGDVSFGQPIEQAILIGQ